jgi:hypothetical protein
MKRWWLLVLLWSAAQCSAETLSHGRFENLAITGRAAQFSVSCCS